jgi:hypothetical protein
MIYDFMEQSTGQEEEEQKTSSQKFPRPYKIQNVISMYRAVRF